MEISFPFHLIYFFDRISSRIITYNQSDLEYGHKKAFLCGRLFARCVRDSNP